MRGGGGERQARRASAHRLLKAAAVLLLFAAMCALIAGNLKPDHNTIGLMVEKRATKRTPAALAPPLKAEGKIRVNYADKEELEQIKGVGGSLAEAIITERETNGRFTYPEDLLAVRGIGRATLLKLLPQITLD